MKITSNCCSLKKQKITKLNPDKIQQLIDNKKINSDEKINIETLKKAKIISKSSNKIKILGKGEIKTKVNLDVDFISKSAEEKLQKIGAAINLKQKK